MYAAQVDQILQQSPEQAVSDLAVLPEGQWFERKSGRISPRQLAVPLVAFANAEGGCVVVGVHDGKPEGVPRSRLNSLMQAAHDFTHPVVRATSVLIERSGGDPLLLVRVEPGSTVYETTSGDCYLRVGDESRKLGFAQRQELEFDRGTAPFDGTPARVELDDLDAEQLESYRKAIGATTVESMLRARSLLTRDGAITTAAYLLFGGQPQMLFPEAYVRVLQYRDVERGTGAGLSLSDSGDVRCEGSIPQQIMHAAEVIENLMPRRRALAQNGRFEGHPIIPREAWLEGLVNAVIHRSYSLAGDHIRVEIFPDRVEITSPGRFPGLANPAKPLEINRYARNPRIARVCSDMRIAQELGEGIQRIFQQMRTHGLIDPLYTQSTSAVRLRLSASDAVPKEIRENLSPGALRVLDVLRRSGRPLGTGQIADAIGMSRPTAGRHLHSLQSAGLVSWRGDSPKDPRAVWMLA